MTDSGGIVYRIDARDRIVFLNDEWDRFAAANGGGAVASALVLDRPLWDFVTDASVRVLYRSALSRVRDGHRFRVPFRCDSPARRRLLEMTVERGPGETVEFRTRALAQEGREPQPLLDAAAPRSDELLRMCGWCRKVFVGDGWAEVEEAVRRLRLFERRLVPAVTHGICAGCYRQVSETLATPEPPPAAPGA